MTADKKLSYIECLYHTSKKVYKYWLAFLAAIGVIIGLWFVISNAWDQIVEGYKYIVNSEKYIFDGLGYILSIIGETFNQVWAIVCGIQWYWWVLIGAITVPLILVAIYCALKRFGFVFDRVDIVIVIIVVITILSALGMVDLIGNLLLHNTVNQFDVLVGGFSCMWWLAILCALAVTDNI
jgi:hypothetical protein